MDKKIQIENLIKARKLCSDEEYRLFEETLQSLQGKISTDDIENLCEVFCDDTQDDEVMFELLHLLEQLRGEKYLEKIAVCSPHMKDAHNWAMTLNKRIINHQAFFEMYISVIRSLSVEDKKKIMELLEEIKKDNPQRFAGKIDYLNRMVNEQNEC